MKYVLHAEPGRIGLQGSPQSPPPDPYRVWVRGEAAKIKSDGCTHALEIAKDCCLEHDLGYYYGRDPRDAYKVGWEKAERVTRSFVDHRFRDCNPDILRYRWWGVRLGGWNIWRNHRKLRP